MNKALIKVVPLLLFCGAWVPYNATAITEAQMQADIERLEKKLEKIEKKSRKRDRSIQSKLNKYFNKLKFNGFGSAGLTTSDVDAEHVTQISNRKNYQADAVIGLQATFMVNDKTDAVLQIVGRGIERNNAEAEWAYISHSFTPNFTVRAGRLRLPSYNISEILEVGFAYPWARPIPEIYNQAPFTSYYGVDFFYNTNFMGLDFQIQGMNGTDTATLGETTINVETMYGLYFTLSKGDLSLRFGALSLSAGMDLGDLLTGVPDITTIPTDFLAQVLPADAVALLDDLRTNPARASDLATFNEDATSFGDFNAIEVDFYTVGLSYDNGTWVIESEAAELKQKGLLQGNATHYISLGRRFNNWMPFAVYAKQYTDSDTLFGKIVGPLIGTIGNGAGFDPYEHATYTAGLRYDIQPGVAIKVQLDHLTKFDNTRGNFNSVPGDDAQIFSVTIDSVF